MNIIVTGASRGIGKAIILKFAKEGFNVAFCSRDLKKVESLAEEVKETNPRVKVYFESCDVAQKEDVEKFAKNALAALGYFDIIVNNAGVFLPGEISDSKEGDLEKMMNTNLFSAY